MYSFVCLFVSLFVNTFAPIDSLFLFPLRITYIFFVWCNAIAFLLTLIVPGGAKYAMRRKILLLANKEVKTETWCISPP